MQQKGSQRDFSDSNKFNVHMSSLSTWSPLFEMMFSSEFREKSASGFLFLRKMQLK